MGVPNDEADHDALEMTEEEFANMEFADCDGTPITTEDLARSIEEAVEDLRARGPVPGEQIVHMLNEVFAEFEQEQRRAER